MKNERKIDLRYVPPVKGIDLEQSLNYLEVKPGTVGFFYNEYTSKRTFYRKGSRAKLERIVERIAGGISRKERQVEALARFVSTRVPWAGYYEKKTGSLLPAGRALAEEEIIESGFGWCNEQARVLCALTQICGISSRLVFACNPRTRYGHTITEVLLPQGWMAVDQSLGYCFKMGNLPIRAWDLNRGQPMSGHFSPIYKNLCKKLISELGGTIVGRSFSMGASRNPLNGFDSIGVCNYFIH